jgi:hypothetical protein
MGMFSVLLPPCIVIKAVERFVVLCLVLDELLRKLQYEFLDVRRRILSFLGR